MRTERFHEAARREFDEALEYYEVRRAGLGVHFVDRVAEALLILDRFPRAGTPLRRGGRRREIRALLLPDFPIRLIYVALEKGVFILAVAHTSRRSGYWHKRLKDLG